MFHNLFLTSFRNLVRNRFYSILNITGLAVGMAVFMLIVQYVHFENNYEDFVPDSGNIYRVAQYRYQGNTLINASAENYPALGPVLKSELPEATRVARLYNMGYKNNVIITRNDNKQEPIAIKQRKFLYADSSFLPMMGYKMIKGNAATALAEPFTAVVSDECAKQYFGNEDPIGKVLHMHDDDANDELVKITGIFQHLPLNTHLKFDLLFSYQTLHSRGTNGVNRFEQNWGRQDMYTFVQLREGTDYKKTEAKLQSVISRYKPMAAGNNEKIELMLQPLKAIHLTSDLAEEPEANGNKSVVGFITIIGLLVVVIAWINYVNLATAKAIGRAKEVGVRKVLGVFKYQLILQFLLEAGIVNLLSLLIALAMVFVSLPYFNAISGLSLTSAYLFQPWFIGLLLLLWITGSLLSGFYPAAVLSSFKPVTILKGKFKNSQRGVALRKGMVVAQFVASIVLIAGTFIIYRQLQYMMNQNLGMNINQVLVLERPAIAPNEDTEIEQFISRINYFRQELKKEPGIEAVSSTGTIPGKLREYKATLKLLGNTAGDSINARINSMDYEFMDVFKMQLLAGRNFSRSYVKDPDTSVIITASAARLLGFHKPEDAIGKVLEYEHGLWKPVIVGVINDYHQVSLKKALDPTLFVCDPYRGEFYSLRINTTQLPQVMTHVQEAWTKAFPGNPFESFFLDDYFNRQYVSDKRFGQLFTGFSVLAIIISCLGLFGLSAFTASQRIKEIGVRKILGASASNIVTMLSMDFLKLVVVSIVIALPLTWMIMNSWLNNYATRIQVGWWIFALSALLTLLIALGTVSFQAIKAALANPVKSLRTE